MGIDFKPTFISFDMYGTRHVQLARQCFATRQLGPFRRRAGIVRRKTDR